MEYSTRIGYARSFQTLKMSRKCFLQGLCAASQQMDDLFDILIESGGTSEPFLLVDLVPKHAHVSLTINAT